MQTTMTKVIRITEKTYTDLAKRGTLQDTFDSVIQRLLTTPANPEKPRK